MAKKAAYIGRPPMYKTPGEMQVKIDDYFKACQGEIWTDKHGEVVYDKFGKPIVIGAKHPTVTGLALALGFTSRQALLNYEAKDSFVDTVSRAKAKVEDYAEQKLFESGIANGAKFALSNNFSGWADKQEVKSDVDATIKVELAGELGDYSK